MRHYELMVILDPSLDERTVTPSLEQFLTVVKNDGGTVEKIEVWGKRRLAFEILKHAEGIYAVIEVACEPATISELDRQLGLNESVLRTKVLRREPKKARAQKAAAPSSAPASAPTSAPRTATSATAAVAAASAPAAAPAAG